MTYTYCIILLKGVPKKDTLYIYIIKHVFYGIN